MRVQSSLTILALSILTVLVLVGATTQVSLGDATQVDVAPMMLESVADTLAGGECTTSDEAVEAAEVEDVGAAYECPRGIPYCQAASQCADYCGGGFEACIRGCCACAG